ncbi:MAG: ribosome recycling factor [Parcubacteria group bacterium CG10_big_fil_rev_8_21_14_0_10_36_14]|nr:MAG: ribosome recycling factor [Parcubacteria group bacterium CG10_big_fil_rev_8_21_14_0_10_36_14]
MDLSQYQEEFSEITNFLKEDLAGLRTGRANAAMVDNIIVDAYGGKMALKGVASVNIPDARTIVVDPWDKSLMKEIESAIRNSGKNLNPVNEGNFLRIAIPALTEESRKELVKLAHEKAEAARIKIRQLRERIKDEILKAEEDKEIAEDRRFKIQDDLDKKCSDYNANIKEMAEEKEKEVMTV